MSRRRLALWLCALCAALCFCFPASARELTLAEMQWSYGCERALLIGVNDFVSKASMFPIASNNVRAMQTLLETAARPPQVLNVPEEPVTSPEMLTALIRQTFEGAGPYDVSFLYLCTHGEYDAETGQARLLLSDGTTETGLTPAQLEAAFDGIDGMKIIILDACSSGAFIGKGLTTRPEDVHFLGDDFKVLTSSGALEESWYWSLDDGEGGAAPQGAFYFTQALTQGLSASAGYPADQNRDGNVTLSELYTYLLLNHAASTPQVYPQTSDAVVFRYDAREPLPTGSERSPVADVTFSDTVLGSGQRQISLEFIATRPVRVAYQIVFRRSDGKWDFANARLIYDGAERYAGSEPGAVTAGRKVRTVSLGSSAEGSGYVLVQLVSIDEGRLTVHAGRVISILPSGPIRLSVSAGGTRLDGGRELSVFVEHDAPCELSVAVVDAEDCVVYRICHRRSTRPTLLGGSVFYWNGVLKDGTRLPSGTYRIRAQAHVNDLTLTEYSAELTVP